MLDNSQISAPNPGVSGEDTVVDKTLTAREFLITPTGDDVTMVAVSRGDMRSRYASPDNTLNLTVSHSIAKRIRRLYRLDFEKVSADPFTPALNIQVRASAFIVLDEPKRGFSREEMQGLLVRLVASVLGNGQAFVAGES